MDLIIVESPTKAHTISKFLGKKFIVKSSYGHVRDLPKNKLGVDENNGFKPQYVILPKARKVLDMLKKYVDKVENIYLATDYDREGESIAWHLVNALKLDESKVKRITFHEITPQAIKTALENPRTIDISLVNSQQARRVLDRLVGYKLSPLLWKKIVNKLSAGRVQSVALRFIYEREKEIRQFVPQEYWTIEAEFYKNSTTTTIKSKLKFIGETKLDKLSIKTQQDAETIVEDIKKESIGKVIAVTTEKKKKSPLPPFVTSTLQQEASWKFKFSPSKTMAIAQSLYEGVDLGGNERVGLITYMRTDSVYVSPYANEEVRRFIRECYTEKYLFPTVRKYKTKIKNAQEAHEAIRPTSVYRTPEKIKKYLSEEQYKLYKLIWERFVATQMKDMEYEHTIVNISVSDKYIFESEGKMIIFDGYTILYPEEKEETLLPQLSLYEELQIKDCVAKQHFTEPPQRYTEASLIKELEKHGIGRPSTYATIVDTLKSRGYVKLKDRKFEITPLGEQVIQLLIQYFPEIVDKSYTANIEELLDEVSEGKRDWVEVVKMFYDPLKKSLSIAEKEIKPKSEMKTDMKCPICGSVMIVRNSRFGKFLSCQKYPQCKYKMEYNETNKTN